MAFTERKFTEGKRQYVYTKEIVPPAIGEHKRIVEEDIEQLLTQDKFDFDDFDKYVNSMIDLLGGVLKGRNGQITGYNSSDEPHDRTRNIRNFNLKDEDRDMYFRFSASPRMSAQIEAVKPGVMRQELDYGSIDSKKHDVPAVSTFVKVNVVPALYRSFLLSEDRTVFSDGVYMHSDKEEITQIQAQQISRDIFEIYKKQEVAKANPFNS